MSEKPPVPQGNEVIPAGILPPEKTTLGVGGDKQPTPEALSEQLARERGHAEPRPDGLF